VRVEEVPGSVIKRPTDAVVRITASCVCGSDLWPYGSMSPADGPARMGHELIGIVQDTGSEVTTVKKGDVVVAPFAISDGVCELCREGLHTSCIHPEANFWDGEPDEGGQAEAIRVPLADGTLVKLPVEADSALVPSVLTLSDVLGTGYHAAVEQALGIVRASGVISRVGVPQYVDAPIGMDSLFRRNLRLAGGPAPVRAYIEELMPDILDGTIEPGKVLDATIDLDGVPAGYQDMADRTSLKVLVKP
jgi:threonine dehydrogenase-like Zn-dependent dehydrogenase